MDLSQYQYFLIVDLEATCCNDKIAVPPQEMETIEIGAVMVEAKTLAVVDEFVTFIKPVRHPQLTPFCTELTTITQTDVDAAPGYCEAVAQFKQWLCQYDAYLFCSWGDYDRHQLTRDSEYHAIPYPLDSGHLNIKKQFSKAQGIKKRVGMARALKMAGLTLEGNHHRGIDDAKNMVRLMPYVLGREHI